ncbi:hypothetical protein FB45DRAFT_872726 [Roridomyces roridus]|uniref:Uncharacterized protein n=1 Tax=Roridomyces roridus TaxID=1738132 RepID=A0AAD7FDD2_9AGAR|nr:hypothetical protein FB45DRAFT_872726 [Roridomyces roridus]
MFPPFEHPSQFYPGLIVWCDPNSYEMDISTLAHDEPYDQRKARELRPCLVVAVDYNTQTFQVARLCATQPSDTRRWVRVDTTPTITWRLPNAWLWVGTPPTVAMVLNNPKVMHPHKDTAYTENPVASSNLQNYWIHRQNYIERRQMGGSGTAFGHHHHQPGVAGPSSGRMPRYPAPPARQYTPGPPGGDSGNTTTTVFNQIPSYVSAGTFNSVSPQPVVVPAGFTETHPGVEGWFRNPQTGWFWHASEGLRAPNSRG